MRRRHAFAAVAVMLAAWLAGACRERDVRSRGREGTAHVAAASPPPTVRLPSVPGAMAPSFTEVRVPAVAPSRDEKDAASFGAAIADGPATCSPCHADAVAQWQTSAHAFASFDNPIYRASVDAFRQRVGQPQSRFCAGCHDPALLVDGAMVGDVEPGPRAVAGVSCLTCHGTVGATNDGNGSYSLRRDAVVLPVEGDAASLRAHKARFAATTLRTETLCASCHRSFLGTETGTGHHLAGADDYGQWLASVYGGSRLDRIEPEPIEAQRCSDCHMPREPATRGDRAATAASAGAQLDDPGVPSIRSHRFTGGHTWLADMRGDPDARARAQQMLARAAKVDLPIVRTAEGDVALATEAAVTPGTVFDLEVVVTNTGAGHAFPGGTQDMHDVWLEVVVRDADGDVVGTHGEVGPSTSPNVEGMGGAAPHRFRSVVADASGHVAPARDIAAFRAVVFNNTIGPRDSVVVPYRLDVPASLETSRLPLVATVRLLHRSRDAQLARRACAARSPSRFHKEGTTPLDGCAPQPVTVISEMAVSLGPGASAEPSSSRLTLALARRLLRHGTAWQHVLVDEIDKARPSLSRVVDELPAVGPRAKRLVAAAQHQLAVVAARQGRVEEMETWLQRAERHVPGHPALAYTRARALTAVFRHADAVPWLRVAASAAPRDPRGWRFLATALGSAGEHRAAMAAVHRGLALAPRDPDLLRTQSLAATALGLEAAGKAREAFITHRRRDDAPTLRALCAEHVPGCALESTPAHRHLLVRPKL